MIHSMIDDAPGVASGPGPAQAPVDLAAVQADDALLTTLLGAGQEHSGTELARVLVAWRRDVEAEPFGELVDPDDAVAAIGRYPRRRRRPMLGAVAATAAVVVIVFSGVGLVAKSAQPGDQLWPVTEVLYGDYARSVEAAIAVRAELAAAQGALRAGDPAGARRALDAADRQLPRVGEAEGRAGLVAWRAQLQAASAGGAR